MYVGVFSYKEVYNIVAQWDLHGNILGIPTFACKVSQQKSILHKKSPLQKRGLYCTVLGAIHQYGVLLYLFRKWSNEVYEILPAGTGQNKPNPNPALNK
jgi:hypothetical protein